MQDLLTPTPLIYELQMRIEIKNIKKSYSKKEVLRDVSFSLESGECVGILGGNGCGKSTLLSILAGNIKKDSGSFEADGKDIFSSPQMQTSFVGYVPQGTPLMEELTARDNLSLWYDKTTMKNELQNGVLSMLGISEFLNTTVSKMSGGMKKRLSIGCAVAGRPPILLLDEPGAALDILCKKAIADYIDGYKKAGGAVILVTHDPMELELCDKWFVISNGVSVPYEYTGDLGDLARRLK